MRHNPEASSSRAQAMGADARARLLSRLVDQFERRGWREDGQTAMAVVGLVAVRGGAAAAKDLGSVVTSRFRVQNSADLAEVRRALLDALR